MILRNESKSKNIFGYGEGELTDISLWPVLFYLWKISASGVFCYYVLLRRYVLDKCITQFDQKDPENEIILAKKK